MSPGRCQPGRDPVDSRLLAKPEMKCNAGRGKLKQKRIVTARLGQARSAMSEPDRNDVAEPDVGKKPRRVFFRIGLRILLGLVACVAVVLWTLRKLSDELSAVRKIAHQVEYGLDLDQSSAIETLTQATGEEIDVALPALIKLQAGAKPDDRSKILIGMAGMLTERLEPRVPGLTPASPQAAAPTMRLAVETLCAALSSPQDATRAGAAQAFRMMLRPEKILGVFAPVQGSNGLFDIDMVLGALQNAAADPLETVRKDAVEALAALARSSSVSRRPPCALPCKTLLPRSETPPPWACPGSRRALTRV